MFSTLRPAKSFPTKTSLSSAIASSKVEPYAPRRRLAIGTGTHRRHQQNPPPRPLGHARPRQRQRRPAQPGRRSHLRPRSGQRHRLAARPPPAHRRRKRNRHPHRSRRNHRWPLARFKVLPKSSSPPKPKPAPPSTTTRNSATCRSKSTAPSTPALVPAIIDEAHKNGMRVSGHIPAGMIASQCVELGYDEIQHINFLVLNFFPEIKDTNTITRLTKPGEVSRRPRPQLAAGPVLHQAATGSPH